MKSIDKIAIIGMGYVGLPLAIEFGKKSQTYGFDINSSRIKDLHLSIDKTLEIKKSDFKASKFLTFTDRELDICECNIFIVTVPTPIDRNKNPDLSPLKIATSMVSSMLKNGDIVIFESTVYPGLTNEICVPILERSNLVLNKDFSVGYSPERINPGDKTKKLTDIVKVVSGSNVIATNKIKKLYQSIISAGVFVAKSIEVAEAAKVIENTQRDINIALINELSVIFHKLGINTYDVLETAKTKWNFLDFKPGLVGGHCIGVDPYYLTFKAKSIGIDPKVILSGRETNDNVTSFIYSQLKNSFKLKKVKMRQSSILLLGLTFKENCPDTRNSKVFELAKLIKKSKAKLYAYDPYLKDTSFNGINNLKRLPNRKFDAVLICTPHKAFLRLGFKRIKSFANKNGIIFDIKNAFPKQIVDFRL